VSKREIERERERERERSEKGEREKEGNGEMQLRPCNFVADALLSCIYRDMMCSPHEMRMNGEKSFTYDSELIGN